MKAALCALLLALTALSAAAEEKELSKSEQAKARLEQAESLYADGAYEQCREFLDNSIRQAESREVYFPGPVIARMYLLRALIAYAFRVEGEEYKAEITSLLKRAVESDLGLDIEDPAGYPPFILELFRSTQREYLARYTRRSRRFSVGILGALVIDSTVLSDPSLLQPGLLSRTAGYGPLSGLRLQAAGGTVPDALCQRSDP